MDQETPARRARPKLNLFTKVARRERILGLVRQGWPRSDIAREENLSERRVREIVSEAARKQPVDKLPDHARLQLVRIESAQRAAAEAIAAGDLSAITPYLGVLERLDRYQKAAAAEAVYDEAARARLFAKLSRAVARAKADKTGKTARRSAGDLPPPERAGEEA